MIQEALRSIGLAKNEVKIYLALLELGPSLMGQICAKTNIHRRNVYDSIGMLKDKGFACSTMVNNRNVFEAVSPKRILDILDEKKSNIQEILPKLLISHTNSQSVRVYAGRSARKVIFEDKLNYKEEQLVLGAHEPSSKSASFVENYHRRRIQKKIHLKMLFINNAKDAAKRFSTYNFVKVRVLPKKFSSPIAINIYGEKTAIFLGSQTMEQVSILIEDKGLAEDFRTYFEMLWNISK